MEGEKDSEEKKPESAEAVKEEQPKRDEGEAKNGLLSKVVDRIEEPTRFAHLPKIGKLTVTSTYKDIIGPSFYRVWNDFLTFKYSTYVLDGGRGCVDGDTLLDTPNGKIRIRDFKGGLIYAYDGKQRIECEACKPIMYTKERLFRVTLNDGKSVLCTDEHRFLTQRGWLMAKDLKVGDSVAVCDDALPKTCHASQSSRHATSSESPDVVSHDRTPIGKSSCTSRSSTQPSSSERASCDQLRTSYEESQSASLEDALRSLRTLLGCLYRYWQDFRRCDALPPLEGDTYLNVLRRLADAHEPNDGACSHTDGLDETQLSSLLSSCVRRLSTSVALLEDEGRCSSGAGSCTDGRFFERTSRKLQDALQCLQHESLFSQVRTLAGLVLSFCNEAEKQVGTPRTLFCKPLQNVDDTTYSDSFGFDIEDDVNYHDRHYIKKAEVVSIEFEKEDYYYDMFVPFYNNYVAEGIVHHNSLKSSAISIFIMCGLERDRKEALRRKKQGDKNWRHYLTHAVCYRKVFGTCEQSVYSQLEWAIDKLNLNGKWVLKKSPLKIVRPDTGQMILFRGLDDPLKSKSLKAPFSFFRYLWFEEAAEFDGIAEIRNVSQSVHRGGFDFQTFYSYNPPETSACWINREMTELDAADPMMKRYHSDYRTVPPQWLGEQFFAEANVLKRQNYRAWRHEYLGEITGNGGTVFPNVVAREVTDEEISHFANLHWGCDFGTVDPTVLVGMEFDKANYRLIIFREVYESNMMLDRMEKLFKATHYGYEYIRADCAAKQMIMELEARGLPMLRAEKGPDSIMHGVKWLQNLKEIVIDPARCKNTYDEFSVYEYEKSKLTGEFTAKLPDHHNHSIDAVRYAVEDLSGNGGVF